MRPFLLCFVVSLATCCAEAADPVKPSVGPSLDDELFKGLDDATTAPGLKSRPSTTKPTEKSPPQPAQSADAKSADLKPSKAKPAQPAKTTPTNPLDEELLRALEGDEPSAAMPKSKPSPSESSDGGEGDKSRPSAARSDDPFLRLTEQIRDAEARLRRTETGDETQQLQREIVDELEKLIAQIEKQQQQQQKSQSQQEQKSSSSSQPQPGQQPNPMPGQEGGSESKQARDSQQGIRNSTARAPDPGNLRSLLEKAWGSLPERDRQAVMQSSVDDFPAKYQYVIEEYFKALLKREE